MRIVQIINVNFPAGVNQGSKQINVGFKVRRIVCKEIGIQVGTPAADKYVYFISDLVKNQPLGIIYQDDSFPLSTVKHNVFDLNTDTLIQGNYTFYMNNLNGTPAGGTVNGDNVSFLLEFLSEEELF